MVRLIVAAVMTSAVAAVSERGSLRSSVLDALRDLDAEEDKKPKCSRAAFAAAGDDPAHPCNICGCTSCPCCVSGGDNCPPEDSVTCLDLHEIVSNGGKDPLACAQSYLPGPEVCQSLDSNPKDGIISRDECQTVVGHGGNKCMWYSYEDPSNPYGGACLYNPCSNVNDGSCTLQQTGGRCVWYGNPDHLRTINGVKEFPNPYQKTSGCYMSPCNNPSGISVLTGKERPNTARGCEEENPYNPYKCQWCNIKTKTQGMKMGCQNVASTSTARASRMGKNPEQGKAPCGNYYCNFMVSKDRTNNNKNKYPAVIYNNVTGKTTESATQTYTWVGAYGDGSAASQCTCPEGDGNDVTPVCPNGIPDAGAY